MSASPEGQLDTTCLIETPEGVDLEVVPAGPVVRMAAYLADLGIRLLVLVFVGAIAAVAGAFGQGLTLLVYFALEWLYPVLFETLRNGQTPGKKLMGLRVIRDDGTPVGWGDSALRNLLRTADFLPVGYALGLCTMLVSGRFQRLGDLAAGTLVVGSERPVLAASRIPALPPVPPPVPLELAEQRAIVHFAERATILGDERAREIASRAEPLTRHVPGATEHAVHYLCSVAAWLAGRRPSGEG